MISALQAMAEAHAVRPWAFPTASSKVRASVWTPFMLRVHDRLLRAVTVAVCHLSVRGWRVQCELLLVVSS